MAASRAIAMSSMLVLLAGHAAFASPVFRVTPAGQPGVTITETGLLANGGILVGSQPFASGSAVVRWTPVGGLQVIGNPSLPQAVGGPIPLNFADAHAVSADGSVIVGTGAPTGSGLFYGYRWDSANGFQIIASSSNSHAHAVSADGTTAAGYSVSGIERAWRWTQPTGQTPLLNAWSFATDVSADGSVVAGYAENTINFQTEAFRWTQTSGAVPLTSPAGYAFVYGKAISDNGNIIAGDAAPFGSDPGRAVRWVSGVPELLPLIPGASNMTTYDISGAGDVVVGQMNTGYGFVWTAALGSMDAAGYFAFGGVDLTGWTRIRDVMSVSPDGRWFTGHGDFDLGNGQVSTEVYVVAIPAPWASTSLALAGLVCLRRRR